MNDNHISKSNTPMFVEIEVATKYNDNVPPIEQMIAQTEPLPSGLYPHEVLLLSYVHKYTTSNTSFEGFWRYKYGINNIPSIISSLCKKGYVAIANIEQTAMKSTTQHLKSILKEHSLKVGGKKDELVHRLLENISEYELEKYFPARPYVLTQLGYDTLKHEEYIHYIHIYGFGDLDIWSLSSLVRKTPDKPFKQTLWNYLDNQFKESTNNKLYSHARHFRFDMAEMAFAEKSYDICLQILFEIIYFDLSGITTSYDGIHHNIDTYVLYPSNIQALIAPGIISRIHSCSDNLNLTNANIRRQMTAVLSDIHFPSYFYSADECVNVLIAILLNDSDAASAIHHTVVNRYRLNYPNEYIAITEHCNRASELRLQSINEAKNENKIYDPEFEKEIEERLSKLDDLSRSEFYRIRAQRNSDDTISDKDLDILTLEAMEKSHELNDEGHTELLRYTDYLLSKDEYIKSKQDKAEI